MSSLYDLKIFRLNRLRYQELWDDAVSWVRKTYNAAEEQFTMASPFAQLLSVMLHLGRMILYYIEDSVTGLNIRTAYRPDQIRGLARLAGHDSTRAVSARAAVRISYVNNGDQELTGRACFIPNKTKVQSLMNGASYVLLFNADTAKITMSAGNYVDANMVQGTLRYQRATGTGEAFQSFNISERNYSEIEEYFLNVYVNGVRWDVVKSLEDLGYKQKGVKVATGQTGGIDLFFGNGDMGDVPPSGASIVVEYLTSDGVGGNLGKELANSADQSWVMAGNGYLQDGTQVSLNDNFRLTLKTDLIFGAQPEDITQTQLLAPHASRSFVLANETNYRYFFSRMNMFSTIEVVKGYSSQEANAQATVALASARADYSKKFDAWEEAVSKYGDGSSEASEAQNEMQKSLDRMQVAQTRADDTDMADNTVYILLIPDISKRLSSTANYFTCDESLFTLTQDEQYNLLQMIEDSGQKIITMENRMLEPKTPRFAVDADVKIWDDYDYQTVYSDCMARLSDYLVKFDRKDIVPVSDVVALFEGVAGVDSVRVRFAADRDNEAIYGKSGFYGIDEFGDVVLTRTYVGASGNVRSVRDVLPLFRGGFTSPDGTEYSATQSPDHASAFNLNLVSYTKNRRLSLDDPVD